MAARVTDKQKQKILADYVELGSYNAVSKMNGVSDKTVRKIVLDNPEIAEKFEQKRLENTEDVLTYMEERRKKVCSIIDLYLDELLNVRQFKNLTPSQLTTAIGTLIDKWTMIRSGPSDKAEEDALSKSLKELGEELESDGGERQN